MNQNLVYMQFCIVHIKDYIMKIFDKTHGEKVNFVDQNNVFVGYDLMQDCCEHADWFIADQTFPDEVPEITEAAMLEGLEPYSFDKEFFEEYTPASLESGGMAIFKLVAEGQPDRYLHLYNNHNGYYSHGFEMKQNDDTLREGHL